MSKQKNDGAVNCFMQHLRFRMNQIEAQLQTEESGNKIAFLQGNCAGFRSLCAALVEAGYEDYKKVDPSENTIFAFDEKDHSWSVTTSKYEILIGWHNTAMDIEEVMSDAKKQLDERINKMKDRLFYQAEKGRELYYVKGWYCILSCFDDWCEKIHEAYRIAQKDKDESLDFDDPFDID